MGSALRGIMGAAVLIGSCWRAAAQPIVSVSDTQVVEGNTGTTNANFVISFDAPYTNSLTVQFQAFEFPLDPYQQYESVPWPAHSGIDFIPTNGTVTFLPGETNKTVTVQVIGDTINEHDERFGLGLTLQGPGTLTNGYGTCLIYDDDPLEIVLNHTEALEGSSSNSGLLPCTITTLEATEQTVYALTYVHDGTAIAGFDYYGGSPIRWTLDPGPPRTVMVGYVPIIGDDTNEDDETVTLSATLGIGRYDTNPQNARGVVFLNQNVECTIINDDFCLGVQPVTNHRTQLTLVGASNATHILQSSRDLVNWTSFSTNTPGTVLVTNNGQQFFRALRTVDVSQ